MKYKILLALLLITFNINIVGSNQGQVFDPPNDIGIATNNEEVRNLGNPHFQSFTIVQPISINGNVDLNQTAFDLGMQGNGSQSNPYVFTNLAITGNHTLPLISISSVTLHVRIHQNMLTNGTYGIKLFQVANVSISENIINENTNDGIFFENGVSAYYNAGTSFLHEIFNNTITDNGYYGIHLYKIWNSNTSHNYIANNYYSGILGDTVKNDIYENNIIHDNRIRGFDIANTWGGTIINNNIVENHTEFLSVGIAIEEIVYVYNATITNNWVANSREGILLNNGNDFKIINNTVLNSDITGIYVEDIDNSVFEGNIIRTGNRGFSLSSSQSNNFTNNLVYNMDREGILTRTSSYNRWINNSISRTGEHAFELLNHYSLPQFHSTYNIFTGNNFLFNNPLESSQGFDEWTNNTYSKNYWSDSTFVNNNGDGYVDDPYYILGTPLAYAQSRDDLPLTKPNYAAIRGFSNAVFTLPNTPTTVSGELPLVWDPAVDYWFGNLNNYSIFYSTDNSTWNSAGDSLSEPTYNWDTLGITDGIYYIKLVSQTFDGIKYDAYMSHLITVDNPAHSLTKPAITSPKQDEIMQDTSRIYWNGSTDSWGLVPEYEVQYRSVGTAEWTSLDIVTARTYFWDHNEIAEGEYEISIVAISLDLRVTSDIVQIYIEKASETSSESSSGASSQSTSNSITDNSSTSKSNDSESGFISILNFELVLLTAFGLALVRLKGKVNKAN